MSSCTDNIFSTPYGNKTLVVDSLSYDHTIISSVKNLNVPAMGSSLLQNKVGRYNNLTTNFVVKFTNFEALSALPDSVYATINSANAVLYVADYWGTESDVPLGIAMLPNDTTHYWTNISDPEETFELIEGSTVPYSSVSVSTMDDSLYIPIDLDLVNDWYTLKDSFYVNNGFTVKKSSLSDGLIAFHSIEYSSSDDDLRPRLRLECSINDTNDVFIKDSTFYIYGSGDLQYAKSYSSIDDEIFYLSQGNIYRSFMEFDEFRQDTLLGPTDLLNKAELSLVMDEMYSSIAIEDTALYLTARLFKTDYWDGDSIQYSYTAYSPLFDSISDTIKIDISQLIQYLISNPKEMAYEGIFFYLNNEYNDFNSIKIDPAKTQLDVIYTKVKDE